MIAIKDIITAYGAKTPQELANIPDYVAVFGTNGAPFTYKDNEGVSHTVYITANAFMEQLEHYTSWYMLTYSNLDQLNKFFHKLKAHINNKQHAYDRMLTALRQEYSPIENVEEHTNETVTHTGTIEHEGENTTTIGGKRATATDNNVTNSASVYSWENNNDIPASKNVGSGSTVTQSDQSQDTSEHETTETLNTADGLTRLRHGNIGVSESSSIAKNEITFREIDNFTQLLVHGFANEYLALCEGVF